MGSNKKSRVLEKKKIKKKVSVSQILLLSNWNKEDKNRNESVPNRRFSA